MKALRFGLAAILAMLPPAALAADKKADSIDELAKMYDVSACKECHAGVFEEWAKSYHAKSLVGSPRTMATIATTVTDGLLKEYTYSGAKEVKDLTVEHMMICAKCHLPQLKDATDKVAREIAQAAIDGAAGDQAAKDKLGKVGINCLICHNQKALIHKWTDGKIEENVVYGSKDGEHPHAKFTKVKKSLTMPESIMCGQCHGLGPNFELAEPTQCATLYGSYLHAYVPSGGSESCQDCHMRKAGTGHYMPGYRDPAMAKDAVDVKVDTRGYYFLAKAGDSIPTAVVKVKMTSQAGHRIPDGWPSPNRVVLDVTAKSSDGKVLFNEKKIYTPQSPAKGRGDKMVFGPHRKSGMLRDTTLQPGKPQVETFEIKFPYSDAEKDGKMVRTVTAKEMDVTVALWHLPAGGEVEKLEVDKGKFLFHESTQRVTVK